MKTRSTPSQSKASTLRLTSSPTTFDSESIEFPLENTLNTTHFTSSDHKVHLFFSKESVYTQSGGRADKNSLQNISDDIFEDLSPNIKQDLESYVIFCKRDWKKISRKLARIHNIIIDPYQLRMHFTSNGQNRLPKSVFTPEQDRKLIVAHEELGNNWLEISRRYFDEKCPLRLKNRFYTLIKENQKGGNKKKDKKLILKICDDIDFKSVDLKTLVSEIDFEPRPAWLNCIDGLMN